MNFNNHIMNKFDIHDQNDTLLEMGLFKFGINKQRYYLEIVITRYLKNLSKYNILHIPPKILYLITHYIFPSSYFNIVIFWEEYLTLNKIVPITKAIQFDNSCMIYTLNEKINGLKNEIYIFEFNVKQYKNEEIYIGIETNCKWYYLNLKTNKILSNKQYNTLFKLIKINHNKQTECKTNILVKFDFNNTEKSGSILMKLKNKKWLNTGLNFSKHENIRIVFGCAKKLIKNNVNVTDNTYLSGRTKIILISCFKKINETNYNVYKMF